MSATDIVLAFSGGLDTSYCVVWLKEQGFNVHTYYVDTAGPGAAEASAEAVEARALELGAATHRSIDASDRLWEEIVTPLVAGGEWRQGRYPLLCSDRYLIVKIGVEMMREIGAEVVGHGCTGTTRMHHSVPRRQSHFPNAVM